MRILPLISRRASSWFFAFCLLGCLNLRLMGPTTAMANENSGEPWWPGEALKGDYYGLVYDTEAVQPRTAGFIRIRVKKDRRFRGKIFRWTRSYPTRGRFSHGGYAEETVYGVAKDELPDDVPPDSRKKFGRIFLNLDPESGNLDGQFRFRGSDPTYTAQVEACRTLTGTPQEPVIHAGNYTMVLNGDSSLPDHQGSGYATLRVKDKGTIELKGMMPDNTKLTAATALCEAGDFPVYDRLDQRVAALMGWAFMTPDNPSSDLGGTLYWLGPQSWKNLDAPLEFLEPRQVEGSLYQKPRSGQPVLSWMEGHLVLGTGPDGGSISNRVTWTSGNKLEPIGEGVENLKISVKLSQGTFRGSFRHPSTLKTTRFSGVLLQKQDVGRGFFHGGNISGDVWLGAGDRMTE